MRNFEDFKKEFDKIYDSISTEELRKEFEVYGYDFKKANYKYFDGQKHFFENDLCLEYFLSQSNNKYLVSDDQLTSAA
jgi:hypothetical protein